MVPDLALASSTGAMIISSVIFAGFLVLVFSERLQRTIAAIVGAAVMVIAGLFFGFYTEDQAVEAIDLHTIGLLLGMMLLVAMLQPTGFFEYVAIRAGRLSRGRPVVLFILLGTVTTVLSLFLDNVTTVVLIAPVVILISEVLGISPLPFLIAVAILSDTGGAGTLVGDPPNVLIGSAAGLTFNDFLTHSLPIVIVVWFAVLGLLLFLFRSQLRQVPVNADAIRQLDPAKALDHPTTARRVLIVLAVAVFFFFIHHIIEVSPALIALSAAAVAMVWVRPDMHTVAQHVEWSVLIFFVALFVVVGGLEAAGVLDAFADFLAGFQHIPQVWQGIALIWGVAVLSAIVDNIPITIAMIPVIQSLQASGINVNAYWWALVFGAGFGGNGTIIGSTANVVVVTLSEKTRNPITSPIWSRYGIPAMIVACAIASVLYYVLFPYLSS
jgi:Na+/H+ antiporter NhaD/arsenite permease-like protein